MGTVQKKCSACGETLEQNAAFCTNCGQRLAEDSNVKKCPSCGASNKAEDAFCSDCGSRLEGPKPQVSEPSPIAAQLLALSSDFLSVRESSPGQFEFSSETGAQSAVQRVKIKYTALAILDAPAKQVTFWEKMVESSAGMTAGVFAEKTVQKGIDVNKKINGQILFGGKYGFEYGKLKDVVKAIAGENGWNFKPVMFKPKATPAAEMGSPRKDMPVMKILILALVLVLIAAIGAIGYFYYSSRSTNATSPTKLGDNDARSSDVRGSSDSKVFKEEGPATGGNRLIETDKDTYNYGEKIRVHYYKASGYPRDWICIVPEGSRNTYAGDYQYVSSRGRGVLTFSSPRPGRYEVRAFYYYIPGRYNITARYHFTVNN